MHNELKYNGTNIKFEFDISKEEINPKKITDKSLIEKTIINFINV